MDINRIIYDLKDLKKLKNKLYFVKYDFIKYGYRAHPKMTWGMCSKTMFMCHCETSNIYSHFLPALYFII